MRDVQRWPAAGGGGGRRPSFSSQTTIVSFLMFAFVMTLFVRMQEGLLVAGPGTRIVSATLTRVRNLTPPQTTPRPVPTGDWVPSSSRQSAFQSGLPAPSATAMPAGWQGSPVLVPEPQDLVPV